MTAIRHFIAAWEAPRKPVLTSQLIVLSIAVNRQWPHTFRGVVNLQPSLFGALHYVAHITLLLSQQAHVFNNPILRYCVFLQVFSRLAIKD